MIMTPENSVGLTYDDVLIIPQSSNINSRSEVELNRVFTFKWGAKPIEGKPIFAANMFTTGTFEMARELQKHQMFTCLHKYYTAEQLIEFLENNKKEFGSNDYIFLTSGLKNEDFHKMVTVGQTGLCENICLDAPNGYITNFKTYLHRLRFAFPKARIIAGNVCTGEGVGKLINAGADLAKCGIGNGNSCQTRIKTAIGVPSVTMLNDCLPAAKQNGADIIADGGLSTPGNICVALASGAAGVMLGGMLAGSNEASGKLVTKRYLSSELDDNNEPIIEEKQFKEQYGMSSKLAQAKHCGEVRDYRTSEGIVTLIPATGPVEKTLKDIEGGIRSCCTYINAKSVAEMQKQARLCRTSRIVNRAKGSFTIGE